MALTNNIGEVPGPDIAQLEAPKVHSRNRRVSCVALGLRYVTLFFFSLKQIMKPIRAYDVVYEACARKLIAFDAFIYFLVWRLLCLSEGSHSLASFADFIRSSQQPPLSRSQPMGQGAVITHRGNVYLSFRKPGLVLFLKPWHHFFFTLKVILVHYRNVESTEGYRKEN